MPLKDPELRKQYQKLYRDRHKLKIAAYQKTYREQHDFTEYKKEWHKEKRYDKYGLTKQQYEDMLVQQQYRCKICQRDFTEKWRTYIDHCHSTSEVRGLLCFHCNTGLGHFQDRPEYLYRALCYLEKVSTNE